VILPHGRRQPCLPGAIALAEAAIAVAGRMDGAIFLPEQLERHPWPAQLAVIAAQSGCAGYPGPALWRRVEQLQGLVRQALRQRSGETPALRRPMQSRAAVALTPRLAPILRLDMPAADSLSTSRILRMGNPGPGICPASCGKGAKPCRFADHQRAPVTTVHRWSRSPGLGVRGPSERVVANPRPSHAPGRSCR
jgi:hypothetical protein